jgi:hypothetical protein
MFQTWLRLSNSKTQSLGIEPEVLLPCALDVCVSFLSVGGWKKGVGPKQAKPDLRHHRNSLRRGLQVVKTDWEEIQNAVRVTNPQSAFFLRIFHRHSAMQPLAQPAGRAVLATGPPLRQIVSDRRPNPLLVTTSVCNLYSVPTPD